MREKLPVRATFRKGRGREEQIRHHLDNMIVELERRKGVGAARGIWCNEQKMQLGPGYITADGLRLTSLRQGCEQHIERLIEQAEGGDVDADWVLTSSAADLMEAGAVSLAGTSSPEAAPLLAYSGIGKRLREFRRPQKKGRPKGRPAHQLRNEVLLSTIERLSALDHLRPTRNEASAHKGKKSACSIIAVALAEARRAGKDVPDLTESALNKIWEKRGSLG